MDAPLHNKVLVGVTVMVGGGITDTVATAEPEQVGVEPMIVYVVVVLGDAETTAPKPLLKEDEGVQEYAVAPVAVNVTGFPPTQVVPVLGETVIVNGEAMVMLTVLLPVHPFEVDPTTV
jgi:hypothetical protein